MHCRKGLSTLQALHSIGKERKNERTKERTEKEREGENEAALQVSVWSLSFSAKIQNPLAHIVYFPLSYKRVQCRRTDSNSGTTIFFFAPCFTLRMLHCPAHYSLPPQFFLGADNVVNYSTPSPFFFSLPCLQKKAYTRL